MHFVGIFGTLSIPDVGVLRFPSGDTTALQENYMSGLLSGWKLVKYVFVKVVLHSIELLFIFTFTDLLHYSCLNLRVNYMKSSARHHAEFKMVYFKYSYNGCAIVGLSVLL